VISRRDFLRGRVSAPPESAPATSPHAERRASIGPRCIAYTENVFCRSCGDACEPGAIRFSPQLGGMSLPTVLQERCTGCGDCVPVCPASAILLAALAAQTPK
jgi:ferredoxin-type protein NapF